MEKKGYKKLRLLNTFQEETPYKGINTAFETPDGELVEIQFHTPMSYDVKENVNHPIYKESRKLSRKDPRKKILIKENGNNSSFDNFCALSLFIIFHVEF